jgi:predicted alpha/beta-hydrolase family hydrolase
MDTPFMESFAKGLGKKGFRVVRFEYPYMAVKRETGKAKPPDREPVLRETWLKVISTLGHDGLVVGGKSMDGKIASLVADEAGVAGLVCLGYPFHRACLPPPQLPASGSEWAPITRVSIAAALQPPPPSHQSRLRAASSLRM